jgi:hypothetical protein
MRPLFLAIQTKSLVYVALLFAVSLSWSSSLAAQKTTQRKQQSSTQQQSTIQTTPTPTPTPKNPPAIEIKLDTIRKQIIPGTPMGVIADITNNSEATVYMRERDVQLVLPSEIDMELGANSTDGWFPTEDCLDTCPQNCPPGCGGNFHVIALKTKETYRVFWNRSQGAAHWYQFLQFSPGTYPISLDVKYWSQPKFDGDDYHTAVETKGVEFAAPQWVIILGAVFGGLIFTALEFVRAKEETPLIAGTSDPGKIAKAGSHILLRILGSILLSVIITILLSRIEQTAFFIKVTVSDLWGAIAIGFFGNYGGMALIDKMVSPKDRSSSESTPKVGNTNQGQPKGIEPKDKKQGAEPATDGAAPNPPNPKP